MLLLFTLLLFATICWLPHVRADERSVENLDARFLGSLDLGSSFRIALPSSEVTATVDEFRRQREEVWAQGSLDGEIGSRWFGWSNGEVLSISLVTVTKGVWNVTSPSPGVTWVQEVPEPAHSLCIPIFRNAESPPKSRAHDAHQADPSKVWVADLLILYTPAARDRAGGEALLRATAELAVEQLNYGFEQSGINARLRLSAVSKVAYAESCDLQLRRDSDVGARGRLS